MPSTMLPWQHYQLIEHCGCYLLCKVCRLHATLVECTIVSCSLCVYQIVNVITSAMLVLYGTCYSPFAHAIVAVSEGRYSSVYVDVHYLLPPSTTGSLILCMVQ